MKYNTEVINEIAFKLAEMLKSAVKSEQKSKNGHGSEVVKSTFTN
ncbi:MAG: hypothetical protein WCK35_08965 [Chloroflexota bacterium]